MLVGNYYSYWLNAFDYEVLEAPSALFINPKPPLIIPPVAKLKLVPSKAYRHVDDPITISALAVDANNAPVPDAKVTFSVLGDCEPRADTAVKTTSATGIAMVTVIASRPGVVTALASGVDANGAPVVSQEAAHVEYFEERHYGERHYEEDRERDYYYGPRRDRYVLCALVACPIDRLASVHGFMI